MCATRINRPDTAFTGTGTPRRRPRQRAAQHLKWLRTLPCVICGKTGNMHAAHLRTASPRHGKRAVGFGEKPDDCWTTPLCMEHHLIGEEAQHQGNELAFWLRFGIDPFALALALWRASGDDELGFVIIREAHAQAHSPDHACGDRTRRRRAGLRRCGQS
jgi:hypothetical protein